MLKEKIQNLDIELAQKDILPFLRDPQKVDIWSKQFFLAVSDRVKCESHEEEM